jgi:hypothetical protein
MDSEPVYHMMRKFISGGIANVLRKYTKVGETKITKLEMKSGVVYAHETDWEGTVTNIWALDANSLYPSSTCSKENEMIPYTDHKMYMPARLIGHYTAEEDNKEKIMKIISNRKSDKLFITTVKGSIRATDAERKNGVEVDGKTLYGRDADEYYINKVINFPPILRNNTININRETLGDITMNQIGKAEVKTSKTDRKLTQMLDTNGEFYGFSTYYLHFLIDTCHFVIDDVEELALFTRTDCFREWYEMMMMKRIKYMLAGNSGGERYIKMCMNSSYGFDGLNEEKFAHTKIVDADKALACHKQPDFISTRQISRDRYDVNGKQVCKAQYLINYKPRTFKCKTCLHCSFFTLDNSKFWVMNFVYNFVYKSVDLSRVMIIYADTDCVTFAVAGDENKGIDQGFEAVITDKDYWDDHKGSFLPDPTKGKEDEKKLLGFATENIGDEMIALAPKNYILHRVVGKNTDGTFAMDYKKGLKGVSKEKNPDIDYKAFRRCYFDGDVIPGENIGFHTKNIDGNFMVVKDKVRKIALSGVHTKMVVMEDGICAPFIKGLTSADYVSGKP